jgi:flagellar biosynthesis/type III secretory pathway chaperone
MNITKQINDLIDITSRLADLLTRENDALRNHNTHEASTLLNEKNSLSEIYEDHVKAVMTYSEKMKDVDPSLRERLSTIGAKAKKLIEENAILLRAAIVANQRVMDLVADALSKTRKNITTYSADGTLGTKRMRKPAPMPSLTVDHSL